MKKTNKQLYLELIDETFAYYYNPDGTEIPGRRSESKDKGICLYKGPNGVTCAASRLLPGKEALWDEDNSCHQTPTNIQLSYDALKLRGITFEGTVENPSNKQAAEALQQIQKIHDYVTMPKGMVEEAKKYANKVWPDG